uniref:FYVE-type domain-containing protein n=1 Tax=Globisporangium ultimum (strain ATCC 200006 / CBS 805.95 / DAOM BR144) TaxID=431595 RepID=K3X7S0_GLOUD
MFTVDRSPVTVRKAAASAPRNVRLSDERLVHMALSAARDAIDWDALRSEPAPESGNEWFFAPKSSKKRTRRSPGARVYTRQDHSFAVMAQTQIPCSLQELMSALKSTCTTQFVKMMYDDADVSARVVHTVPTDKRLYNDENNETIAFASDLFVKAVSFDGKKKNPLFRAANKDWCYLDFMQRVDAKTLRKTMLSIHPDSVVAGSVGDQIDDSNQVREVISGFLFQEADDGKSMHIAYSGEHFYEVSGSGASKWKRAMVNRTTKTRLLRLAESIDRVHLVVRRQRLGMQTLVDHINVSASNSGCIGCKRSFLLTRKRVCNLCGHYVCDKCSDMEDRELRSRRSCEAVVTSVRVCDKCVVRVDKCSFVNVALEEIEPAQIYPDPPERASMTTGAVLTDLLHETLVAAPESRKSAVLSVIKHLVQQDSPRSSSGSNPGIMLTPESSPTQHFDVLQSKLTDLPLPLEQCEVANTEERTYLIDHADDDEPEASPPHPIPGSEAKRLEIVRSSSLTSLVGGGVAELDIICSVISKELECMGAMVSISEADFFHVVATNIDALPAKMFPRNEGFCSRTIMGTKPMLVPHPEADIRFNYILPVKHLGISFYCGFPLFAEDYTVLGSLCCLGHESRKLTQSQFTVAKKLADTASRVLQYQVRQRQSSLRGK